MADSNRKVRLYLITGLLGSGKTTIIKTVAEQLQKSGYKVAAITNDQSDSLVDTVYLQQKGISVREVTGSCFCCDYNALSEYILDLVREEEPDVILAEPVGSCTDINATIVLPMKDLMANVVEVMPLTTVVDPGRLQEISSAPGSQIWSLNYLLYKQLEEADIVLLNKTDLYDEDTLTLFQNKLAQHFPQAMLINCSGKQGINLLEWFETASATTARLETLKNLDYLEYGRAEAEMGWLNARILVTERKGEASCQDVAGIASQIIDIFRQEIAAAQGYIGNIKILAKDLSENKTINYLKASGVTLSGPIDIEGNLEQSLTPWQMIINVRATVGPDLLVQSLQKAVACLRCSLRVAYQNAFRPKQPNPTHHRFS